MSARLGFSIAVYHHAEILLVNDVLAVGDFEFEKKCVSKIDQFRQKRGTMLVACQTSALIKAFSADTPGEPDARASSLPYGG